MTNKKPLQQQVCDEFSSSVETKADHNDSGNGSGRSVPHTLKEAVHEAGSRSVASRWQRPQCVLVLTCMVYADRTEYVRLRLPMQACIKLMYFEGGQLRLSGETAQWLLDKARANQLPSLEHRIPMQTC
jgi:hypothetical protein